MYNRGVFYLQGLCVEKDMNTAQELFKQSAEKGNHNAIFALGKLLIDKKEYEEGIKLFTKAAKLGNANAMCAIGALYWNGTEVEKNEETGEHYIVQAYLQGDQKLKEFIMQSYRNLIEKYLKQVDTDHI